MDNIFKTRYLKSAIVDDLGSKMIFLGGPRQVGKTTFSKFVLSDTFEHLQYFNWDNRAHRKAIMAAEWPAEPALLVFDEIHKYSAWKSYIKGEYDVHHDRHQFLVTGSTRLDVYQRGGDSLQGRYHYYRMHPFSLCEMFQIKSETLVCEELVFLDKEYSAEIEQLFTFGGFPDPLIKQNETFLRRWHNERLDRMVREDIRSVESLRDISNIELLKDLLPSRVASLLSINSLRNELEVSHNAVKSWIEILEAFYYSYRVYPFQTEKIKSLKKDAKLYLWDWSEVRDAGARFENMIASHLLKYCHYLYDHLGYKAELMFIRDLSKKEIDFLVCIDRKPWFAVEVKLADTDISSSLYTLRDNLGLTQVFQVVKKAGVDFVKNDVRVMSAGKFLTAFN